MWNKFLDLLQDLARVTDGLDRKEWIGVFVIALVIGFFCMRGFGSRTNY